MRKDNLSCALPIRFFNMLQVPVNTVLPKEKANGTWVAEEYYCLGTDKFATEEESVIFLIFNGSDFYVPAVPDCVGLAHEMWVKYCTKLDELKVLNNKMKAFVPEGSLQKGYKAVGLCLKGTKQFIQGQSLFTGDGTHENLKMICLQLGGPPGKKRKLQVGLESANLEPMSKMCKKPHSVCFCGTKLQDPGALAIHLTSLHPNSTNWQCSGCDKLMTTSTNLWKHYRSQHLDIWLYKCNKCTAPGSKSDEMSVVMKHMADKHGGPKAGIVCARCQHVYSTGTAMRKHAIGCGNKDKHFPCTYMLEDDIPCPKSFREKSALSHHVKVNHGPAPKLYQCTQCSRGYEYSQGLKYHMEHHRHHHTEVSNPVDAVKEKTDRIVRELLDQQTPSTSSKNNLAEVTQEKQGEGTQQKQGEGTQEKQGESSQEKKVESPQAKQGEASQAIQGKGVNAMEGEESDDDPDKTVSVESSSDHEGRGEGFSDSSSADDQNASMETEVTFKK